MDMVAITMEVASIINELATIFEPKFFQASPNFFKPNLILACAFSELCEFILNVPISSVIVFLRKLVQRVLFEQAAKVFGAEEIFPAGQQTQPPAIRGYCAEKSKEKKQLKHFTILQLGGNGYKSLFAQVR